MESAQATPPVGDDERPVCERCGSGRLIVIDERPHPLFGILGMIQRTLQCDRTECAQRVID
jgi:hypothetical protein